MCLVISLETVNRERDKSMITDGKNAMAQPLLTGNGAPGCCGQESRSTLARSSFE